MPGALIANSMVLVAAPDGDVREAKIITEGMRIIFTRFVCSACAALFFATLVCAQEGPQIAGQFNHQENHAPLTLRKK
jgi:hypothetical protein